ncbi:hypothetical protein METBIDRAFT_80156 [Metschnikowia bicuspidata var. bicuspidata NRRL YB-4993]|uniref:F-box domain-containing protein n=1 Tax=Metschnikowia bicuspidata var. bicuspidata NRRL YB-4993 TaxID=869754 RepID=A0A1A0GZ34_9ASCO|nr:hypothetical protein METBIDRAFT_80156 [Metschnikowia bicuspidata var. bicuspidata NRRL YB-4993]OBA16988.1 hypothetical protein METBIDRAFT_80156 [Metschnikowia bicuspidata var. bicuspidata NRRL YB-4993]
MKKYQLIGRKKVAFNRRTDGAYPPLHICLLPFEVLLQILSHVQKNVNDLLLLALTCSKLNTIILKFFLYRKLSFLSALKFDSFAQAHLPHKISSLARRFVSSEPSGKINFITSVHFVNPPTYSNFNAHTHIAGSYAVDTLKSDLSEYRYFVKSLQSLLNEAFGLKEVRLSEISPQFDFAPELVESASLLGLKSRFKSHKQTRCLEKLVLTAQSGWTIPFKASHVSLFTSIFQRISILHLNNFVINEQKLVSESPSHPPSIESLLLSACIYVDSKKTAKRKCVGLFVETSSLEMSLMQHGTDLSLIDLVKVNDKLSRLSIDISSAIFYHVDSADNKPKFNFTKYNNFFKLVCSGAGGYANLKEIVLTSFDLFHTFSHQHEKSTLDVIQEEGSDGFESLSNTFEGFLKNLSAIPFLTIVVKEAPKVVRTCKNCGFTIKEDTKKISSLRQDEWYIILAPILLNNKCSLVVYDHKLQTLFSRRIMY